jgi:hypothetical protein
MNDDDKVLMVVKVTADKTPEAEESAKAGTEIG